MNDLMKNMIPAHWDASLRGKLEFLMSAGRVQRMHTQPHLQDYSIGVHVYGSMCIAMELARLNMVCPAPAVLRLLYHDAGERATGDVPAPVKRAIPGLRGALEEAETAVDQYYGMAEPEVQHYRQHRVPGYGATALDLTIVKVADALELAWFCLSERRLGNHTAGIEQTFRNAISYTEEHDWLTGVKDLRDVVQGLWDEETTQKFMPMIER